MKFFQPVIFLLNKLRFSVKFFIVGCVLLIPMFAVSAYLLHTKSAEMNQIEKRLEGADYSVLLKDLLQYIQQSRALQISVQLGNGLDEDTLNEVSNKVNGTFDELEKKESKLGKQFHTKEQLQEIRGIWDEIQNATWSNTEQITNEYTYLIDQVISLMESVINHSELLLSESSEEYNLIYNATMELPKLLEQYSELQCIGINILNSSNINDQYLKQLNEIYYPMQTAIGDMIKRMDMIFENPSYANQLQLPLDNIEDSTAKYLSEISMIGKEQVDLTEFNTIATKAMNDNYDFYTASINVMKSKLQDEYHQLKKMVILNYAVLIIICFIALLIFVSLYLAIRQSITKLTEGSREIAKGNLDVNIALKTNDEMKKVEQAFNDMTKQLNNLVREISLSAEQVAASSQQLSASVEEASANMDNATSAVNKISSETEVQVESLNESAQAMNEMVTGIERIAENSVKISSLTNEATQFADEGNQTVEKAIGQMQLIHETVEKTSEKINELHKHSEEIDSIVNVISEIAEQTNLLALNAAIEAARAGEHGKGFAVVAESVRKLAEQSKQSTNKIAEIIQNVQKETTNSVEMMEIVTKNVQAGIDITKETAHKFHHILSSMQTLNPQMEDISSTTTEFSAQVEQVAAAIQNILEIVKQTSDQTAQISSSVQEQLEIMGEISSSAVSLSDMADSLQNLVARFKLQHGEVAEKSF